uniref:Uncharacterized protein n=1 Tax=Sphaerodactylus townsendi TaxID=933632 RepID=A0ACB8G687_9SAUR
MAVLLRSNKSSLPSLARGVDFAKSEQDRNIGWPSTLAKAPEATSPQPPNRRYSHGSESCSAPPRCFLSGRSRQGRELR